MNCGYCFGRNRDRAVYCPYCHQMEEAVEKSQWVQHISGQGEKWEVIDVTDVRWRVKAKVTSVYGDYAFPKSEYALCEPPEVWVDVTEECVVEAIRNEIVFWHKPSHGRQMMSVDPEHGYRLRKVRASAEINEKHWVTGWAFIVEKKGS